MATTPTHVPQSGRALAIAVLITFVVTIALLLSAVRLGLLKSIAPSAPEAVKVEPAPAAPVAAEAPAPTAKPLFSQAGLPKGDSREFSIGPFGSVEFGYTMAKDQTLVFAWKATGPLSFDLHTEPAGKPPDSSDSFEMGEAAESHGAYVAPYDGIHGWFWENATDKEVTLTLDVTGFFSTAILYHEDGTSGPVPIAPPVSGRRRVRTPLQ